MKTSERIITGYRKDIKVDDERFPAWAMNSGYAEQLWELWNSALSNQTAILQAQDEPKFRKTLTNRCEQMRNR